MCHLFYVPVVVAHKFYFIDKILQIPVVINHTAELFPSEDFNLEEHNELMSTIRFPKNIMCLSERLPRASYESLPVHLFICRPTMIMKFSGIIYRSHVHYQI